MLPAHATSASIHRLALAQELVAGCPDVIHLTPISEIALTGSSARGLADEYSDLEINIWTEAPLPADDLIAWLSAAGARDLTPEAAPREDDSAWIRGTLEGIPLEVGQQTFADLARTVNRLISDPDLPDSWIGLGDLLTHAVPLRTTGQYAQSIAPLHTYPEPLRARLLAEAGAHLRRCDPALAERLLRRGEWIALAAQIAEDCTALLRYLYAYDRRWQPGRKWTLSAADELPSAPDDLLEQIEVFTRARSPEAIEAGYALIRSLLH
ncbi:MAG: DUF4037 domain-containing protein [Candidatus Flexifilum sp.]